MAQPVVYLPHSSILSFPGTQFVKPCTAGLNPLFVDSALTRSSVIVHSTTTFFVPLAFLTERDLIFPVVVTLEGLPVPWFGLLFFAGARPQVSAAKTTPRSTCQAGQLSLSVSTILAQYHHKRCTLEPTLSEESRTYSDCSNASCEPGFKNLLSAYLYSCPFLKTFQHLSNCSRSNSSLSCPDQILERPS